MIRVRIESPLPRDRLLIKLEQILGFRGAVKSTHYRRESNKLSVKISVDKAWEENTSIDYCEQYLVDWIPCKLSSLNLVDKVVAKIINN